MKTCCNSNPTTSHTFSKKNHVQNSSMETVRHVKAPSSIISFFSDKPTCTSVLMDSCEIIAKSRGTILGITDSKLSAQQFISPVANKGKIDGIEMVVCSQRKVSNNTPMLKSQRILEYPVVRKEKHMEKCLEYVESRKQLHTLLERNSEITYYTDNNIERTIAVERGDNVLRRNQYNKLKGKPPLTNPLCALKKEVVERKHRMSQYKMKILKTLEDEREDSLIEQFSTIQPVSPKIHKTSTEKKGLIRFPLAIDTKKNHNEVKEKRNSVASKPYAMRKIKTKTEKDINQVIKENKEHCK